MRESAEVQLYVEQLQERIAAIGAALDGLTNEQVSRGPDLAEANSLCVIATHALECARSYVLDIACGLDVDELLMAADYKALVPLSNLR